MQPPLPVRRRHPQHAHGHPDATDRRVGRGARDFFPNAQAPRIYRLARTHTRTRRSQTARTTTRAARRYSENDGSRDGRYRFPYSFRRVPFGVSSDFVRFPRVFFFLCHFGVVPGTVGRRLSIPFRSAVPGRIAATKRVLADPRTPRHAHTGAASTRVAKRAAASRRSVQPGNRCSLVRARAPAFSSDTSRPFYSNKYTQSIVRTIFYYENYYPAATLIHSSYKFTVRQYKYSLFVQYQLSTRRSVIYLFFILFFVLFFFEKVRGPVEFFFRPVS